MAPAGGADCALPQPDFYRAENQSRYSPQPLWRMFAGNDLSGIRCLAAPRTVGGTHGSSNEDAELWHNHPDHEVHGSVSRHRGHQSLAPVQPPADEPDHAIPEEN